MRLYLIRHGKAQKHSDSGRDEDRVLATKGREQAEWLGIDLRRSERPPERLLTSPAARARETAVLIAEGLGVPAELDDRLGLATLPSAVIALISTLPVTGSVALVGHNPTLSIVADLLCQGPGAARGVELRTGQAAVLDLADPDRPLGTAELWGLLRAEDD